MRLLVGRCLGRSVLDNFTCNIEEEFINVDAVLGRGLEEGKPVGVSELLSLFRGNDSVRQVNLVGHQYFSNTLARMGVDLFQPIGDVVKSGFFSAVVDQDNAHGALVVGLGDGSEPLLAGSVPNLQLDPLIVDVDCLDFEIDSCKHHGQPTNRNEEICHQGRSR